MKKDLPVRLVCPVLNNKQYTQQFIQDLIKYTPNSIDWSVTIVDNNSTDGTSDLPELKHSFVKYLRLDNNYGYGGAVNAGSELYAKEKCHLLWINNDVQLPQDWLARLTNHLNKDNNLGIVAPKTNHSSSAQKMNLINHDTWRDVDETLKNTRLGACTKTNVVTGFCMLVRWELWHDIGLLDEENFLLSGEDFDYCLRCRLQAKLSVGIAEDVFVYHYGHKTAVLLGNDQEHWRKGADMLFRKWGKNVFSL